MKNTAHQLPPLPSNLTFSWSKRAVLTAAELGEGGDHIPARPVLKVPRGEDDYLAVAAAALPELLPALNLLINACEQPETPGKSSLMAMRIVEARKAMEKAGCLYQS